MPTGVYQRKKKGNDVPTLPGAVASSIPMQMVGWALAGLEREIAATETRLQSLRLHAEELRRQSGTLQTTGTIASPEPSPTRGKRGPYKKRKKFMTAETKHKLSLRMKRRWKEWKQAQPAEK